MDRKKNDFKPERDDLVYTLDLIKLVYEKYRPKFDENSLYLGGSIAYLFSTLATFASSLVEPYLGAILILSALMIVWFFHDKRKDLEITRNNEIDNIRRTHLSDSI